MQDGCPKEDRVAPTRPERASEVVPGRPLASESLLLLASAIWGFAFVAQRVAMDHIGPFTFNAVRFALGSLPMLPLIALARRRGNGGHAPDRPRLRGLLLSGLAAGALLYGGASLQQLGIVHTTAGKAGFITGLYVIIVPILGLLWKMHPRPNVWAGAVLGIVGLFLLSVTEHFTIGLGDSLVLAGAFFWAGHVILVGWLIRRIDVGTLAFLQFTTCAVLSFLTALVVEDIRIDGIIAAAGPILYGAFISVGIAYTLQLIGQRRTPPSRAAIILGLEAVFAAVGGWAVLNETLSSRALVGCSLMLAGVIVSQLRLRRRAVAG
ncbi:MAG: DMT family transporter [Proteobacteria bacterium]|nr:DMT family transporter [Pseudomonadota bacterium]